MAELEKTVEVQGTENVYSVEVKAGNGRVKIRCNCEAGIHKRLCKHVIHVARTDADLQPFLVGANLENLFDNYYYAKKEIERLQAENRQTRIKIEKAIF